ncbi:phosphate acyltransferase PlsX [bacterium]|nr:phosphate acyltransferase PlsX [bacterium]
MKIAIDAMGGDMGPKVTVTGAVDAAREYGFSICLVGQKDLLTSELSKHDTSGLDLVIEDASQTVTMDDLPLVAVRQKKDSSIRIAAELVKSGEADGMVSAGNTGAVMATAKIFFGALEGVDRPAIATVLPTIKGMSLLLDVGANVDCKPMHLLQFAIMGHAYAQQVLHIPKPTVGILSIGSEESKGNELSRMALSLIRQTPFNIVGNVEGRDIFRGLVDVAVADGFVGNVALKIAEGVEEMITSLIKREIRKSIMGRLGFWFMIPAFKNLKKSIDYAEYGGAPLLGLNKVCIICHGISEAKAIKNAARVAAEFITKKVNTQIKEDISAIRQMIEKKKISAVESC